MCSPRLSWLCSSELALSESPFSDNLQQHHAGLSDVARRHLLKAAAALRGCTAYPDRVAEVNRQIVTGLEKANATDEPSGDDCSSAAHGGLSHSSTNGDLDVDAIFSDLSSAGA